MKKLLASALTSILIAAAILAGATPARAATHTVVLGERCFAGGSAEYGVGSGFSLSPSAESVEVVLPAAFAPHSVNLWWRLTGSSGEVRSSWGELPTGTENFFIPIGSDLFDPSAPSSGLFRLEVNGIGGNCPNSDSRYSAISIKAELAVESTGPADVHIELTRENASPIADGDPFAASFDYSSGPLQVGWGDTLIVAAEPGFWTRGPEGLYEAPEYGAWMNAGWEGSESRAMSATISEDGSTMSFVLPSNGRLLGHGDSDDWSSGFLQLNVWVRNLGNEWTQAHILLRMPPLPTNGSVPTISGAAQVGAELQADRGVWDFDTQFQFQWLRNGAPVRGETSQYYNVTSADVGARLSFRLTGTSAPRTPTTLTSAPTEAVIPVRPGQPDVRTIAGNGTVTVSWGAAWDGGSPITSYRVRTYSPSGLLRTQTVSGSSSAVVITGLTNGTAYSFDVTASNVVGMGASSSAVTGTPIADSIAPTVLSLSPLSGARSVSVGTNVLALFSEPVGNASTATFVLRQGGVTVPATVSYEYTRPDGTGDVAILNPSTDLRPDTTYKATLSGIRDPNGNAMGSRTWSFVTGPAPTVTSTVPAAKSFGHAPTANVTATFDEPVSGVSATNFTLRLGTATVAAVVTYDATRRVATLNPNSDLLPDRVYTARLFGAKDAAGNIMSTKSWTFTTGPAPVVTSMTPSDGSFAFPNANNITATFSEPVSGVSGSTFVLSRGTALIPATVTYNATTRTATLNPTGSGLAADTRYTATISGLRDAAGNNMVDRSWSFTSGPRPAVTSTTPASGATAVRRDANITATFSEIIVGYTGSTARITRVSDGTAVAAALAFNPTSRVLTINPSSTLAANTQFRVTLTGSSTGLRDPGGNPLASRTWTFTTGSNL